MLRKRRDRIFDHKIQGRGIGDGRSVLLGLFKELTIHYQIYRVFSLVLCSLVTDEGAGDFRMGASVGGSFWGRPGMGRRKGKGLLLGGGKERVIMYIDPSPPETGNSSFSLLINVLIRRGAPTLLKQKKFLEKKIKLSIGSIRFRRARQ